MAKYPAPGRVKTRIGAVLGDATASALYRAFVLDLAERLGRLPYPVTWAYWPPEAPFAGLLPGVDCRPQEGADLGARLTSAVEWGLGRAPGAVLVIGADVPHIDARSLGEGVEALAGDADVVLGPAADGGYYLIGLRAPARGLFRGIAWGTAEVRAQTLARAAELGLTAHLLPPTFDVDEVDDLGRLAALLARGEAELPRTARILAGGTGVSRPPPAPLDRISLPGGDWLVANDGPALAGTRRDRHGRMARGRRPRRRV